MEIPEALEPMLKVLIADGPLGKVNKDILLNTAKRWVNLIQDGKPKACRVKKAIYGLCQSGRQWYKKLDEALKEIGLTPLQPTRMYIQKKIREKKRNRKDDHCGCLRG